MLKFLAVDKVATFFRILKQNGGIMPTLWKLWKYDTIKEGKLIGWDANGNRYYENTYYMIARSRWVEYNDAYNWDYDGSQITSEWFGWLHYKTDRLPTEDPAKTELYCNPYTKMWLLPHDENRSGTDMAYVPYSTTPATIYVWDGKSIQDRCSC